jgi:hypothetical protein
MSLGQPAETRATQTSNAIGLREGALDPRASRIALLELRGRLSLARGMQRFEQRTRSDRQRATGLSGARAQCPPCAGRAIHASEADVNDLQTEPILARDPPDALPPRRTRDSLGVPVDAEVAHIEAQIGFGAAIVWSSAADERR